MMKQQILGIALACMTIMAIGGVAGAGIIYINFQTLGGHCHNLANDYEQLLSEFNELLANYTELSNNYEDLFSSYTILSSEYDTLLADYNELQTDYDALNATYHQLLTNYNTLNATYTTLLADYNNLLLAYTALQADYTALLSNYTSLETAFNTLQGNYDALVIVYNSLWTTYSTLVSWIRGQVLPVQIFMFAESIRRHYLPSYLNGSAPFYWQNYSRFMADAVRHATPNITAFEKWYEVRNAYTDILRFGNNTPELSYFVLDYMFNTNTTHDFNWGYDKNIHLVATHSTIIWEIHEWIISNLDFEDDNDITLNREESLWDYIKFPVETLFRGLGDDEDQAIFEAAYLRSCGFDVAVGSFHDDAHPTLGALYHNVLRVNLDHNGDGVVDEDESRNNHWWYKWSLNGSPQTWIILYPSLDEAMGDYPSS